MAKRSLTEAKRRDEYDKEEEEEEEEDEVTEEEEEDDEGEEEEGEERRKRILIRFSGERRGVSSSVSSQTMLCCQADDCDADLGEAKRYHRRHKVCERHAKAAVVSVGGVDQRYCQQCSRFHEISQFDDNKRSCRKRLAGHNERRRKTHPDLLTEDVGRRPLLDMKDRSLRSTGHHESTQMRLRGNPSFRHFQIR